MAKGAAATDIKEMAAAIKEMPQYTEFLGKYSLHMDLTNLCMAKYGEFQLEAVSMLEQNMSMHEDAEGKVFKQPTAHAELMRLLKDPQIQIPDKLRIILLYLVSQEGVQAEDANQMLEAAGLDYYSRLVKNLCFLGVDLTNPTKKSTASSLFSFGKRAKRKAAEQTYDLARYRPALQFTMEDAIVNKLDVAQFPYASAAPQAKPDGPNVASQRLAAASSSGQSVRTRPKRATLSTDQVDRPSFRTSPPLVVFVAGGLTHSELCAAYTVSKAHKREILIGGTEVIAPKTFLRDIGDLHNTSIVASGSVSDARKSEWTSGKS